MTRRQQDPLRLLRADERSRLEEITRAGSERAERVARAKALLAVADGATYTAAAVVAGRRSGDGVAQLVARFNQTGLRALDSAHGGGAAVVYGASERARILQEFQRVPDRQADGTATWSLTTLQRALRRASDGLPTISTWSILDTLWEAGYRWQRTRTWCHTGHAKRTRKTGVVEVTDPDATPKKI